MPEEPDTNPSTQLSTIGGRYRTQHSQRPDPETVNSSLHTVHCTAPRARIYERTLKPQVRVPHRQPRPSLPKFDIPQLEYKVKERAWYVDGVKHVYSEKRWPEDQLPLDTIVRLRRKDGKNNIEYVDVRCRVESSVERDDTHNRKTVLCTIKGPYFGMTGMEIMAFQAEANDAQEEESLEEYEPAEEDEGDELSNVPTQEMMLDVHAWNGDGRTAILGTRRGSTVTYAMSFPGHCENPKCPGITDKELLPENDGMVAVVGNHVIDGRCTLCDGEWNVTKAREIVEVLSYVREPDDTTV